MTEPRDTGDWCSCIYPDHCGPGKGRCRMALKQPGSENIGVPSPPRSAPEGLTLNREEVEAVVARVLRKHRKAWIDHDVIRANVVGEIVDALARTEEADA